MCGLDVPQCVVWMYPSVWYGCAPMCGMDVPQCVVWMYPNVWYGCTPVCGMDVPQCVVWMCPNVWYGCTPVCGMDVPQCVVWMYPNVWYGCVPQWMQQVHPNCRVFWLWLMHRCRSDHAVSQCTSSLVVMDTPPLFSSIMGPRRFKMA